jgi:hypothetical protein
MLTMLRRQIQIMPRPRSLAVSAPAHTGNDIDSANGELLRQRQRAFHGSRSEKGGSKYNPLMSAQWPIDLCVGVSGPSCTNYRCRKA